jgi:hypothetical protein
LKQRHITVVGRLGSNAAGAAEGGIGMVIAAPQGHFAPLPASESGA